MPTQTNQNASHIYDPLLTNFAIATMQEPGNFIADRLFPTIPVDQASAKYVVWDRETFFKSNFGPRPMGGKPGISQNGKASLDSYNCEEVGERKTIDKRERANAFGIDLPRARTEMLVNSALIYREQQLGLKFFKTGVWTHDGGDRNGVTSGTPTGTDRTFWNLAASDPLKVLKREAWLMQKTTGYMPNRLVLGCGVAQQLPDNPTVVNKVFGGATTGQPAIPTLMDITKWLANQGVPLEIMISSALHAPVDGGGLQYVLGENDALLCYVDNRTSITPDMQRPSAAYNFAWTGLLGDGAFSTVRIDRVPPDPWGTEEIAAAFSWDQKLVASDMGCFFRNIVQPS